jgi:hypothetical protein
MNKVEDPFLHEQLTEVQNVGPDDKIMAKLSEQKTEEWNDILNLNATGIAKTQDVQRQEEELQRLQKRFESKRFLFWDIIESKDERFESARQRNKMLAVKKNNDGELVVVEFDTPKLRDIAALLLPPPPDGDDE